MAKISVVYREGEFQEAVAHVIKMAKSWGNKYTKREAQETVRSLIKQLQDTELHGVEAGGVFVVADSFMQGDTERVVDIFLVPVTENKRYRKYEVK